MRVISAVVFAMICLLASPSIAAPNLAVQNPNFDFGEVYQGEQVPHVFTFSNAGDETLVIDRVRSSCGCTAALVSEKNLAPGSTGELKVSFDSTRFRGNVAKTVYLYSNDPAQPVVQLFVKGVVKEVVSVDPAQVNFGTIPAGVNARSSVKIRNRGGAPLVLGTPVSTAEELTVSQSARPLASGEEVTINLGLKPKPGQPRFSGYIMIPIEGGPGQELRIPVYAAMSE